jgi:hypothetical protein
MQSRDHKHEMLSVKQELKQLMSAAAKGGKVDASAENARMG